MSRWILFFAVLWLGSLWSGLAAAQISDEVVRDPTTPLGAVQSKVPTQADKSYVLDSVLISAQRKIAIINGHSLREGQLIPGSGGVKLQRVLPQKVVLQQGANTWILSLSPSVINRH